MCNYETEDWSTIQLQKRDLIYHIIKIHNISYEKYIVDTEYNGISPVCFCGCGSKTEFHKGKFFKYYKDHKNHIIGLYKNQKKVKSENEKLKDIEYKLKTVGLDIQNIINYYNDWSQFKINLMELEKKIVIDHRTIKSYWKTLGLISNEEDFKRISKKHQRCYK